MFPPISHNVRGIIWVITGISGVSFTILAIVLESNLRFYVKRIFPKLRQKGGRPPSDQPIILWIIFWCSMAISIMGTAIASVAPEIEISVSEVPYPTINSTPLVVPAGPDETLLLIAAFDKSYASKGFNATDRIYSLIIENLPSSASLFRVEKYPEVIHDEAGARDVFATYGPTILIWGWYDDGGAQANVEFDNDKVIRSKVDFLPATPESFHFNDVAAQATYITFLSLGMMQLGTNMSTATDFFTAAIESTDELSDTVNPWEAFIMRGFIYLWGEEYKLAIADYSSTIDIVPNFIPAYLGRAVAYANSRNYDLAFADYDKVVEIDPNNPDVYVHRAIDFVDLEEYDLAFADYVKAIEIDPNNTEAYLYRGVAYGDLGEYDLAFADYEKVIELDPNYTLAYLNRAIAYSNLGETDLMFVNYDKAIEIDPNYKEAYLHRGLDYSNLEEYDLAISDYTKAIEIDPNYAEAYLHRGIDYAILGENDLAIADFTWAIEIDPNYAEAYCDLGMIYILMGDFDSAIESLEQGVMLDATYEYPWCKTSLNNARLGIPTPE